MTLAVPVVSVTAASADSCTPPSSSQAGVHWPTGSDAGTFTYQCAGTYAGKWTNQYYVYDPATQTRTAIYAPDYQYDCAASKWTKADWTYWASDNQYHYSRVATGDPGLPTGCPVPDPAPSTGSTGGSSGTSSSGDGSGSISAPAGATTGSSGSIAGTGPGSTSSSNTTGSNTLNLNNATSASMNNQITGVATSGNAVVLGNTSAGGATTGNVQDVANIVNLLQSSSNALGTGSNVVTFTTNIDGDVVGDLLLDPSQLTNTQNASSDTTLTNNVTINNSTSAAINNDINLAAKSGGATVESNTTGGSATTGAAAAVANIVNSINSALMAGKSFIGTININGNLDGDILLPPNFVDQLLAANVPRVQITVPDSVNNTSTSVANNTTVTNTNNMGITNTVNANSNSGDASVTSNTIAGNARSGSSTNTITAFNLTGSNVIGANAILVFVNVQGSWVGVIVNAPAGATAAALGGGITQNTTVANNTTVNNTFNGQINNHITTDARSGDAAVYYNTQGGNATSGDARSAVNLANIENSNLNLTGWLGILFINVFGTWHGSFGVNTDAGNPNVGPTAIATGGAGSGGSGAGSGIRMGPVFRFVPRTSSGGNGSGGTTYFSNSTGGTGYFDAATNPGGNGGVLAATTTTENIPAHQSKQPQLAHSNRKVLFAIGGATVLYILADAGYSARKRRLAARQG